MEGRFYVSCIKINGVPILPPMMTKDIEEEMGRYKRLAVAIERKLMNLRVTEGRDNKSKEIIRGQCNDTRLREGAYDLDSDIACHVQNNVEEASRDVANELKPLDTKVEDCSNDSSIRNYNGHSRGHSQWDAHLDEEIELESESRLPSSATSRSESVITNVDMKSIPNESTSIERSNTETALERSKPQVPKTLNIVPLTLVSPNYVQAEKYLGSSLDNVGDAPKLIRQGSYVLDTPSPMLVAHMQAELAVSVGTPSSGYVPTPTTPSTNTVRRKEWNIAQAKIEWEDRSKSTKFVSADSLRSSSTYGENWPIDTDRKIHKSMSLHSKFEPLDATHRSPSTRSVDCIQAMFAKDRIDRNDEKSNREEMYSSESSAEKDHNSGNWQRNGSVSILNLAQKLGGSLGNLNGVDSPLYKYMERGRSYEVPRPDESKKVNSNRRKVQESTSKLKSSITSDKLLTVYKEIQDMHKKQMAELVSRQQREQMLLQEEFEKQQLLLLTEIRKSFPAILLASENISPGASNRSLVNGEKLLELSYVDGETKERKSQTVGQNSQKERAEKMEIYPETGRAKSVPCPLDYIYTVANFRAPVSCSVERSQTMQTLQAESSRRLSDVSLATDESEWKACTENGRNDNERKECSERKRLTISRQLFPLDSKTVHLPVLDNTPYGEKHIRAATLINAYARGYLTRRMMRTERVIALTNTYKEALRYMLKLHVDAPLNRSEYNFLRRLQLQCDAASTNMVELFAQSSEKRMQVIEQDREIKRSRTERPTSARSYSFATQRTLARKKLKEYDSA